MIPRTLQQAKVFKTNQFGLDVAPCEWERYVNESKARKEDEYHAWMREIGISHTGCARVNAVDLGEQAGTIIVPVSLSGRCVAQSVLDTVPHAKQTFDGVFKAGLFKTSPFAFRPRPSGILAYVVTRDTADNRLSDDQILSNLAAMEAAWIKLHGKAKGMLHLSELGCGGADFMAWHRGFGAKLWSQIKNNTNYQTLHLNDYRTKYWRVPAHSVMP